MANSNSTPALFNGEWNHARAFRAETEPDFRYTFNLRRGTQVVRERSAKPSYASSILARASNIFSRLVWLLVFLSSSVFAQGGPPYYTNDPGTPGNLQWEINLAYMPFLYPDHSIAHTPDVDINFGLGDRIQLTYENAWLRVDNPSPVKFGLGQDQLGFKWRFYDNKDSGFAVSLFPQVSINNLNNSVARGITPRGASVILPLEFSKKLGPIDLNWEAGYNLVHRGPDGWLAGVVVGHEFTKNLELDAEFYSTGTFHPSTDQETLGAGLRYKIHPPVILLLMAGRSVQTAGTSQPYFVGYFGFQFLLPPRPFEKE
jgi:hypothetical protein